MLIAIALVGTAYVFFSGMIGGKTAKPISIADSDGNTVVVNNDGTEAINSGEIKIFVNGKEATVLNPQSIQPHQSATLKFLPSDFGPNLEIMVVSPSNSIKRIIDVEPFSVSNFVNNGDFEQGTSNNWVSLTGVTSSDKHNGLYSGQRTGGATVYTSSFIPYQDNTTTVNLDLYAKSVGAGGLSRLYAGFMEYDKDYNFIQHYYVQYFENTKTTLAVDLKPGDTTVKLNNPANWKPSSTIYYQKIIGFWDLDSRTHCDPSCPAYTYTRNTAYYNTLSGNTITLCKTEYVGGSWQCVQTIQWSGPMIPAGTPVANMYAGSGYNYVAAASVQVPNTWTEYQGSVSGWKYGGDATYSKFRYGTKYVRVMFLANYQQDSSYSILFDDVKVTIS
ncbi:MAG: hypothetical protein GW780_02430 [Candidatus Aenigmarchaeota archaeon]|nr:hypothetical protein [Candidatus Aenigmarchaeota archaeon]NCS71001.1 hypothetical protein [Candidatus Aenigmarchaeota archaeon]